MSEPPANEPPRGDPRGEAERRLRAMLAVEAKSERATLKRVQTGFYGCVTLFILLFLVLLFFF